MDAVKDFFAKYHAVPENDKGVQWEHASDEALIGWLTSELGLLRRKAGDPKRVMLKGCLAEVWARIGRLSMECANQPADWPGHNTLGRLLAQLAMSADLLTIGVK